MNQVVIDVTNTLTALQTDLNSLKQLIHDADTINSNREQLIKKLEKINAHLKTINVRNIADDTTSKTSHDFKYKDIITASFIKESEVRRSTVADIRVHSNKIAESMTYLKNMSKEISNVTKRIEDLNNKTVAFEGSDEEKNEQIKNLESERGELKEELFNFVLETMDHNYEYKELAASLEEENNAMENEIIQLLTLINQLKEINHSLLHENRILNRKMSMWKRDSGESNDQDKSSTFTYNSVAVIDNFDRPTITVSRTFNIIFPLTATMCCCTSVNNLRGRRQFKL